MNAHNSGARAFSDRLPPNVNCPLCHGRGFEVVNLGRGRGISVECSLCYPLRYEVDRHTDTDDAPPDDWNGLALFCFVALLVLGFVAGCFYLLGPVLP